MNPFIDGFIQGLKFRPNDFTFAEKYGRFRSLSVIDTSTQITWKFSNFSFWENRPTSFYITLKNEHIRFDKWETELAWFFFQFWKKKLLYQDRKETLEKLKNENDKAKETLVKS